jgi:hypothetical protein
MRYTYRNDPCVRLQSRSSISDPDVTGGSLPIIFTSSALQRSRHECAWKWKPPFSALKCYFLFVIVEDHHGHLLHMRRPNHLILDAPVVETIFPSERRLKPQQCKQFR